MTKCDNGCGREAKIGKSIILTFPPLKNREQLQKRFESSKCLQEWAAKVIIT